MVDVLPKGLDQECFRTRDRKVNEYETGIREASDQDAIRVSVSLNRCNATRN